MLCMSCTASSHCRLLPEGWQAELKELLTPPVPPICACIVNQAFITLNWECIMLVEMLRYTCGMSSNQLSDMGIVAHEAVGGTVGTLLGNQMSDLAADSALGKCH